MKPLGSKCLGIHADSISDTLTTSRASNCARPMVARKIDDPCQGRVTEHDSFSKRASRATRHFLGRCFSDILLRIENGLHLGLDRRIIEFIDDDALLLRLQ